MAGRQKDIPEVVRERERQAWALRQQGWTHARIAATLEVDPSTISKMLSRLCDRALKEITEDVLRMKADQSNRLDHIIDEALQAWERSKKDAVEVTTETTVVIEPADEGEAEVERAMPGQIVTRKVKGQVGDTAYIAEARAALADLRKLWGLNEPEKKDITSGGLPFKAYAGFDPEQV